MKLEQKELSRMLETAIVAARLAGQRAMEEMRYLKVKVKSEDQLVTQADTICQKIIIDRIKETYPDHGFIAEEGEHAKMFKQPPRGTEKIWWVIDPIDGTNNYAKGMLLFTVHVAAMHEGKPVVGVIFDPATESMYSAVTGGEAQLNGRRIRAGDDDIGEFSSVGMVNHFDGGVPGWVTELMRRMRFRNLGSTSLELAYLAKGGLIADIFVNPKLWDVAAGTLIAENAGAIVGDWQGNKIFPIDLDAYEGTPIRTMAANKKVYQQILELLK